MKLWKLVPFIHSFPTMFKTCGNYSGQLRSNMRKALILLAFFVVENFVLITKN